MVNTERKQEKEIIDNKKTGTGRKQTKEWEKTKKTKQKNNYSKFDNSKNSNKELYVDTDSPIE